MVSFFSGTSQDYVDMYLAAAEGMLVSSNCFSAHVRKPITPTTVLHLSFSP